MHLFRLAAALAVLFFFSGCSSWRASHTYINQSNQNTSVVQLFKKNFKVIGRQTGEAKAVYVFSVFGPDKQNLYSQALIDLEKKAKLEGNARALMNIVVDQKVYIGFFHHTLTLYVSANVIEFTE